MVSKTSYWTNNSFSHFPFFLYLALCSTPLLSLSLPPPPPLYFLLRPLTLIFIFLSPNLTPHHLGVRGEGECNDITFFNP